MEGENSSYHQRLITADNKIEIDKDSTLTGSIHSNDDIQIKKDVQVIGDASASGKISGDEAVTGQVTENAASVPLPEMPSDDALRALADRVLSGDQTLRDAVIDDVLFVDGKVKIEGSLNGTGTVIADGDIEIKKGPATLEDDTFLSLIALGKVKIDKDRRLRAVIRSDNDVEIDKNSHLIGVVIADGKVKIKKEGILERLSPDVAGPLVSLLSPADGAFSDDSQVQVSASFSDDLSGVDPASVRLLLDSVDRTDDAEITAEGLSWQSPALADGAHLLEIVAADVAGNETRLTATFIVDTAAPVLTFETPAAGALLIGDPSPEIRLAWGDANGLDLDSFRLSAGAGELSPSCEIDQAGAVCDPPVLGTGVKTLEASIRDISGKSTQATVSFEILLDDVPPALEITAPEATVLNNRSPVASLLFSDGDSGIEASSLVVTLDGQPLVCQVVGGGASCATPELEEGTHRVTASIQDRAGLRAEDQRDFEILLDGVAPVVTLLSPSAGRLFLEDSNVVVEAAFSDDDLGVDLASLTVLVDGLDIGLDCLQLPSSVRCEAFVDDGNHVADVSIADRAGNVGSASVAFEAVVDIDAPELSIEAPLGNLPAGVRDTDVVVSFSDDGSGIDPASLELRVDSTSLLATCAVAADGAQCSASGLSEGSHTVVARLADRSGNRTTRSVTFAVSLRDREAPELEIVAPVAGQVVGLDEVVLTFTDPSGIDPSSLLVVLDDDNLSGACTVSGDGARCPIAGIAAGPHQLVVTVRDAAGNRARRDVSFDLELQLPVSLEAPADGTLTRDGEITVRGLAPGAQTLTVGEIETQVEADGAFEATVPLDEGANALIAVARSALGAVGTAAVQVVRDTEAPRPVIRTPADGLVTTSPSVIVAGDLVMPTSSGAEAEAPEVRVLGLEATVVQRAFVREDVILVAGENVIEVTARDPAGNLGRDQVTVTFLPTAPRKVEDMGGNGQRGVAGELLEEPLRVRLTDAFGAPLVGRQAIFEVTRGDGELVSFEAARTQRVRTDNQGFAQVLFTLGRRSGEGVHEVTVTSPGAPGAVVFCASADPRQPQRILPVVGSNHLGALTAVADAEAPFPLLAQVFDDLGNPLPGARVTFSVVGGDGHFLDAGQPVSEVEAVSDVEGRISRRFVLGAEPGVGVNLVEATFDGNTEPPASWVISGVMPGSAEATRIAGLVLDNEDEPVPGATVHLEGTELTALTDALGRFEISGAPVGEIGLVVDGSTTSLPGVWPTLEFHFTTIAGHRNELGMPIRLLPLDEAGAREVGGEQDVVIPIAGIAGAELTVFAGSTTFPDGSPTGLLSVTQVHTDKVPMSAPMGSRFSLAWTVQPPGVRFDPPARIAVPNTGGEPPGTVVDLFSFDHDLGEFVSIGTGSVSADGSQLISERGAGVFESGWHAPVPPPNPSSGACQPSACTRCERGRRVPKCDRDCEICVGGECEDREVREVIIVAEGSDGEATGNEVVVAKGQEVDFIATGSGTCRDSEVRWTFGDGEESESFTPMHRYEEAGVFEVELTARCVPCTGTEKSDTLTVRVVELDLVVNDLPEESEDEPHEEKPGGFLVVNDDDDDRNEQSDEEDAGPVEGEDDLLEVKIDLGDGEAQSGVMQGELRLEASAGGGLIRVWESENKDGEIELPKTWDLGEDEAPESVWVEAIGAGSAEIRDIELLLTLESPTLEEPAEDKVLLTAIDLDFQVLPEEEAVGAHKAEMHFTAAIYYNELGEEEKPRGVENGATVEWEVSEGPGSLSESSSTSEAGSASTVLSTNTVPGTIFRVEGRLKSFRIEAEPDHDIELDLVVESDTVVVGPGPPASLELTSLGGGALAADNTSSLALRAVVRDAVGNIVEEDTPVSWRVLPSDSVLDQRVEGTVAGQVSARLMAPLVAGDLVVTAQAGNALDELVIPATALAAGLSSTVSEIDLSSGGTATLTLNTSAGDGTPVAWSTSNGTITQVSPVVSGSATATLSSAGGSAGPVVVTATVGSRISTWRGDFVSSSGVELYVENRFLVGDATENGFETVPRPDGSFGQVPIFATTPVHLRGPAGALVQVASAEEDPLEAFLFDQLTADGQVPGILAGRNMILSGATLDDTVANDGAASLRFGAGDTASIAPAPELFEFSDGLGVTLFVRPEQLAAGRLLEREGSFSLEMLEDGRLQAEVVTVTGGLFTATSAAPLEIERWHRVEVRAGLVTFGLFVDGVPAITAFLGLVANPATPITFGGGFAGHMDDLTFSTALGGGAPYRFAGVGAGGLVQLGADGTATVELSSRGDFTAPDFTAVPCFFSASVIPGGTEALAAGSLKAALAAKGDEEDGEGRVFFVKKSDWRIVGDVVTSFFGGDPETTAGTIANVAGGVLIVGDIGAIVKNLWRIAGFSEKDPNYVELALSGLGLLTELAVGGGEVIDVPISFARAIAARLAGSPLGTIIVKRIKDALIAGRRITEAETSLLRLLGENEDLLEGFKLLVRSDDAWEGMVRICRKFDPPVSAAPGAPLKVSETHLVILDKIGSRRVPISRRPFAITAREVVESLNDDTVQVLRAAGRGLGPALDGLINTLSQGVDAQIMKRVLENEDLYTDVTVGTTKFFYQRAELLKDFNQVFRVRGFADMVNGLKRTNPQVIGYRYELEGAVFLKKKGQTIDFLGESVEITTSAGKRYTDIDVGANGLALQLKRSRDALKAGGDCGIIKAKKWVDAVLKRPEFASLDDLRYAVPPEVNAAFPKRLKEFFEETLPKDHDGKILKILEIPHRGPTKSAPDSGLGAGPPGDPPPPVLLAPLPTKTPALEGANR